jgi:hypothetical protein
MPTASSRRVLQFQPLMERDEKIERSRAMEDGATWRDFPDTLGRTNTGGARLRDVGKLMFGLKRWSALHI